jgi:hypothetical protein
MLLTFDTSFVQSYLYNIGQPHLATIWHLEIQINEELEEIGLNETYKWFKKNFPTEVFQNYWSNLYSTLKLNIN